MQYNTALQRESRRRTRTEKRAVKDEKVAADIAHEREVRGQFDRMMELHNLCQEAGIPWYKRLGLPADALEAMLQEAAIAEAAEVAAVADDRAEMRESLRQF